MQSKFFSMSSETKQQSVVISHQSLMTLRAITAATALSDGYDLGVVNGVSMILSKSAYTAATISIFVSVMPAAVGLGSISGSFFADKFGRKSVLIASYFLLIIGAIIMGIPSPYFGLLLTGRIITGLGIGVGGVVGTVYMAEISPTKTRGSMVGQESLFLSCGLLLGYLSNYAFINFEKNYNIMLGLGAILPFFCLVALLTVGKNLPESPHWIKMTTEASSSTDEENSRLVDDTSPPQDNVGKKSSTSQFRALLRDLSNSPGAFPAILVGILQPLCGIGPILYFSDLTFASVASVGTAARDSQPNITASSIWIGLTKVSILLISTFVLIDRIGRRTLLLCSSVLLVLSMTFVGVIFLEYKTMTGVLLFGFCAAVASYAIGWNIVPNVYPTELLPTRLRTFGLSFITIIARCVSVANSFLYPLYGLENPAIWFFVYAGINLVSMVCVFLFATETLNKPLISRARRGGAKKGEIGGSIEQSDREELVRYTDDEGEKAGKKTA